MRRSLGSLVLALAWLGLAFAAAPTLAAEPDAFQIRFHSFRFDPLRDGLPQLEAGATADAQAAGFRLVQFVGPVRQEWLDGLSGQGARVLQYYPHHTYLVWSSGAALDAALESLPFVRWQGPFQPGYKVADDLAGRSGLISNVDVHFYNRGDVQATIESLARAGATVIQHYPAQPDKAFFDAIVRVDAADLSNLAQIPEVLSMNFQGPRPILDDEMSDQILAGNHPGGVPVTGYNAYLTTLGYDGTGVIWATVDTGVDYQHPDFAGRIVGGYDFPGACSFVGEPGSDCTGGGHGTHVTGIIGGDAAAGFTDGSGFFYGLGVAPNYSIFAMNSLTASGSIWPPAGGWQEHSKRAVLGSAVGGNNSWTTGEGTNHGYQASERTHDFMVRDGNFDTAGVAEPFIEVFSAGNSGPGANTLTAPKEGKNLIIVASSVNNRVGSIDAISSFSSRGPAADGRRVPTIATPGEQISSARNDLGGSCSTAIAGTSNLYAFCSGTSMAAPHTSGAVVLITQWWRTFSEGGADPSPAMAKALLVNNAVDMGTADRWNNAEGWGRVNITRTIAPDVLVEYWDQADVLDNTGENFTVTVGVPDPSKPVRVTVAWSDAPGAAGANPALVNNLNLSVVDGASTYLGNVFSAGWSTTGGSADNLNNLENVFILSPTGGAIDITINAAAINGDGIPFAGDGTDQDFALVCSNCALQPDFSLSAPGTQSVCAPADAVYTINVGQILGYTDPVTLSASGNPAGTSVGFSTNPVTPPGSSTMTVTNTGSATGGSYSMTVTGTATGPNVKNRMAGLNLFTAAPSAPVLNLPANNATNVVVGPTLEWTASPEGGTYTVEVATDAAFTNIVSTASGITGTQHTVTPALNTNTQYFWRVRGANTCGTGSFAAAFSFTTVPAPGDCSPGATATTSFTEGFEAGATGWTSSGTGNTWAASAARVHSGTTSWKAVDPTTVSDQLLVSPPINLPSAFELPISLQFWNYQSFEDRTGGCWDGGVLEITNNGGSTWTRLEAQLQTDPYDGPFGSGNPLVGQNGWCGDPQDWLNSIVDVNAWAGQTVQFRWRLVSDGSVGREGWYIDDVKIQSCVSLIFADGFESGDTSAWSLTVP
ncbi:MAG TPA: S8 family serine peptidase [Thermoanaerobaculia bacterium]|nr:S8 family serine peptidase [Thermoanaerobaculia bacterium]